MFSTVFLETTSKHVSMLYDAGLLFIIKHRKRESLKTRLLKTLQDIYSLLIHSRHFRKCIILSYSALELTSSLNIVKPLILCQLNSTDLEKPPSSPASHPGLSCLSVLLLLRSGSERFSTIPMLSKEKNVFLHQNVPQ